MDQSVPFGHEARYTGIVNTAGTSNWLVQRSINRFGHCNFTVAEVVATFADLANWVENGVKPTP
jgi:hypothetical protein